MGKNGSHARTIREEIKGKKASNISGTHNLNSLKRIQHLHRLATWFSGKASVPSLGALLGHRLAAHEKALGIPPIESTFFSCQRCKTILQPGFNCTVRVERNRSKKRRAKPGSAPQNNVIYICSFCFYRNIRRGTPRGHVKALFAQRPDLEVGREGEEEIEGGIPNHEIEREMGTENPIEKYGRILKTDDNIVNLVGNDKYMQESKRESSNAKQNQERVKEPSTGEPQQNPVKKAGTKPITDGKSGFVERAEAIIDSPMLKTMATPLGKPVCVSSMESGSGSNASTGNSRKRRRKSWSSLKELATAGKAIPFMG
ncbi:uncharacterized protein LOC18423026 [Amborella trichopoda]|uniref:uncharacterized protein LOC18423026 n=1 Tax=Amborella trichopoda TaxID=13333 RepID=UPI0005D41D4D|nr:uncharacterized protein LOC18423026 [Amborella trichopoda]|eukprot:XP_020527053.1 uncharacterized protein LOC18423026 [Amborella trichopoda]